MTSSPVTEIYESLRALDASWRADIGTPSGPGWITGAELRSADQGPFRELLDRIGQRMATADRRTIAASFALRFGWASAMAIAPYLRHQCVPDISLDNVSFKFRESTFLDGTAMHRPRGTVVASDPRAAHATMTTVATDVELLLLLRRALMAQAVPVVEALYGWSGFARRGTWGQLTSSWASHFTGLSEERDDQRPLLPVLERFFAGTGAAPDAGSLTVTDIVATMQPRMHAVTCFEATHLFQRRASCCRYYLLPKGTLCASCPLVSQEERVRLNREFMHGQRQRREGRVGHG